MYTLETNVAVRMADGAVNAIIEGDHGLWDLFLMEIELQADSDVWFEAYERAGEAWVAFGQANDI